MKEVKKMVVDTCVNVIRQLATEEQVKSTDLRIRMDLETQNSTPVFSLFDAQGLRCRKSLKEIIKAGGGSGFNLILGTYIKKMIRDIFAQAMHQLEAKTSSELFVVLYLSEQETAFEPVLAIYHRQAFIWSMSIREAIDAETQF